MVQRIACPWFFKVSRRSRMAQEVCESSPLEKALESRLVVDRKEHAE